MNQRRLYRTIESFASDVFRTDKELLKHVVNEIVKSPDIQIKGGRIWQLQPKLLSYSLIHQIGQIERLDKGYTLEISQYPVFQRLMEQRSILANETNPYLRQKGIIKYSATGVGEKIALEAGDVFQYVLAFNYDELDQSLIGDLNIISLAVTSALKNRSIAQRAKDLAKDIDKAREIQRCVLPEPSRAFAHYDMYGVSEPARIVGGDFFDYITTQNDPDRVCVVIGDAASKGFSAAAQALYVVGALRMGVEHQTKISSLMDRVNKLINMSFSDEQFVTMTYLELTDNKRGVLLYSSAGHNSSYLWHVGTQTMELLEPTGHILGPFPEEDYRVENVIMAPGDVLLMFTDGITEARQGQEGELFGEERLEKILREKANGTAQEIVETVMESVRRFEAPDEPADDKTVVVIKRLP